MILAGLLLKLGGYGLVRISFALYSRACSYFAIPLILLSTMSVLYASLSALRQLDLKKLVAYSSIAHMNMGLVGGVTFSKVGINGFVFSMLSHGLVSPSLFFLIDVLFKRYGSRILGYHSGLIRLMPLYAMTFFVFCLANISFPGTSGFIGELLVLLALINVSTLLFFSLCSIAV
jgi:NADH-quinone oxidoreductase subunit M